MTDQIALKQGNLLDDAILRLADSHSPEEISGRLGGTITPQQVYDRGKSLLKAKNWLELVEEDQLITYRLRRILSQLEGRFLDLDNAMAQVRILKEIGARLDKRATATQVDMDRFYGNQAVMVGQAIELALQRALATLKKAYPELEESVLREAMREALPPAMAEIEARQADG